MTNEEFATLALSFPGTIDSPHFKRTAFKIVGKRIFAILDEKSNSVNILPPSSAQEVFSKINKGIYAVPNKWGLQGWTTFELAKIDAPLALDALGSSYNAVMNKKAKK